MNKSSSKQICVRGIWDSTIPGIKFNKKGVSNFADLQSKMMEEYPKGKKGKEDWDKIVSEIKLSRKKNTKYDCIVGVSGGVDSSYLLVLLKKEGLTPLALNLDNGFNSDISVKNIYKITNALSIDLETYVIDYQEIKGLLRAYMLASLPWIDTPTDLAIKAVMYKIAMLENIKYIIRGNDFRSEGKQPKEWSYGDSKQLKYIKNRFNSSLKLKTYPTLSFIKIVYAGIIKKIKDIRPYYYLNYDKQSAKKTLMEKFGWEDYGGHHHENLFTKFTMSYWLPQKFGIDKRIINLSAQVLSGSITRDQALNEVNIPYPIDNDLVNYIAKKLDFSDDEMSKLLLSPNKNTFDYPSNYKLIFSLANRFRFIIKKIYTFTPTSIIEKETIKNNNE